MSVSSATYAGALGASTLIFANFILGPLALFYAALAAAYEAEGTGAQVSARMKSLVVQWHAADATMLQSGAAAMPQAHLREKLCSLRLQYSGALTLDEQEKFAAALAAVRAKKNELEREVH